MLRIAQWVLNTQARAFRTPVGEQAMFAATDTLELVGGVPRISLMEDVVLARRLRRAAPGTPMGPAVHCSSRRYRRWGIFGMGVRSLALLTALALGVSPDRLARFYPDLR